MIQIKVYKRYSIRDVTCGYTLCGLSRAGACVYPAALVSSRRRLLFQRHDIWLDAVCRDTTAEIGLVARFSCLIIDLWDSALLSAWSRLNMRFVQMRTVMFQKLCKPGSRTAHLRTMAVQWFH